MKDPMEEKLQDLPRAADEAFGGLQATQGLRNRILEQADGSRSERKPLRWLVPAMSCAGVLLIVAGLFMTGAFGGGKTGIDSLLVMPEQQIAVVAQGNAPSLEEGQLTADVGGTASISQNAGGGMLVVDGRYYCLQSGKVSSSVKGSYLGDARYVNSVSGQGGVCSDCLGDGTGIYAVAGMEGAAVVADDGGTLRLFRRTSCGGTATVGGESLRDTLRGDVEMLSLSGVGTVDGDDARQLMNTLFSCASYAGSESRESGTTLTITYTNGVKIKLYVSGDRLMGCGSWNCPEFFSAFRGMFY